MHLKTNEGFGSKGGESGSKGGESDNACNRAVSTLGKENLFTTPNSNLRDLWDWRGNKINNWHLGNLGAVVYGRLK